MSMPSECLNRNIRLDTADSVENRGKGAAGDARSDWIMTKKHEKVDRLSVIYSFLEPRLLNHIGGFDDFGYVTIASEIEENSKRHNSEALLVLVHKTILAGSRHTLFGSEVPIFRANVLHLSGGRIHNLYVACNILVSVGFREVVESLIRDLGNIKLVVSDGQKIIVDVFEQTSGDLTVRCSYITQARTIVQILLGISSS